MEQAARADNGEMTETSIISALRSAALFADLPDDVVAAIAAASAERRASDGETLLTGDQYDGQEFYYVVAGRAKITRADADGEMIIETAQAGEFFGLEVAAAALSPQGAAASMIADRDVRVLCIDAQTFRDIAAHRPSLTRSLMLHFAETIAQGKRPRRAGEAPERRVYAALLACVERDAKADLFKIVKMPKHRELAEKAGADENIVASALARLIQEGAARRDYPGLIVDDMARLRRLAS